LRLHLRKRHQLRRELPWRRLQPELYGHCVVFDAVSDLGELPSGLYRRHLLDGLRRRRLPSDLQRGSLVLDAVPSWGGRLRPGLHRRLMLHGLWRRLRSDLQRGSDLLDDVRRRRLHADLRSGNVLHLVLRGRRLLRLTQEERDVIVHLRRHRVRSTVVEDEARVEPVVLIDAACDLSSAFAG